MYVHIKYIYACSNMLLKRKQASSVKQMEEEEEKWNITLCLVEMST